MNVDDERFSSAVFQHVAERMLEFYDLPLPELFTNEQDMIAGFFDFMGATDLRTAAAKEDSLRTLLWEHHDCPPLFRYGDDGEMQCSYCLVDFKRAPVEKIVERFSYMGMRKLMS